MCTLDTLLFSIISFVWRTEPGHNLEGYENINDKINYLSHPYFILSSLHAIAHLMLKTMP